MVIGTTFARCTVSLVFALLRHSVHFLPPVFLKVITHTGGLGRPSASPSGANVSRVRNAKVSNSEKRPATKGKVPRGLGFLLVDAKV